MKLERKKLLVAAAGVAAINYTACSQTLTSGNLVAPEPVDSGAMDAADDRFMMSGNLVAPVEDAGADAAQDAEKDALPE